MDNIVTTPIGSAQVIGRFPEYVYCKHFADETNEAHRPQNVALDGNGRGYYFRLWDLEQVKESEK